MKKFILILILFACSKCLFTQCLTPRFNWGTIWNDTGHGDIGDWYLRNTDIYATGNFVLEQKYPIYTGRTHRTLLAVDPVYGAAELEYYNSKRWVTLWSSNNWTLGYYWTIDPTIISPFWGIQSDQFLRLYSGQPEFSYDNILCINNLYGKLMILGYQYPNENPPYIPPYIYQWNILFDNAASGTYDNGNWTMNLGDQYVSGNFLRESTDDDVFLSVSSSGNAALHYFESTTETWTDNPNYEMNAYWENFGADTLADWHFDGSERMVVLFGRGQLYENNTSLLLINSSGLASIYKFYYNGGLNGRPIWSKEWTNANTGTGYIGNMQITPECKYNLFDNLADTITDLNNPCLMITNWNSGISAIERYDGNQFTTIWCNQTTPGWFNGWNIKSDDQYLYGPINSVDPYNSSYFLGLQGNPNNQRWGWLMNNTVPLNVLEVADNNTWMLQGEDQSLILKPGTIVLMGKNSFIFFTDSAHLYANGVTFMSLDTTSIWGGISFNNTLGDTIENCTFTNARVSLCIKDSNTFQMGKELIKGNTFNVPFDTTQPTYAVFTTDAQNIVLDSNIFNMQNAGSNTAVFFYNGTMSNTMTAAPTFNIVYNQFNSGGLQLVLNCEADALTPFFIMGNTFTGANSDNSIGLWARKVSGTFKNNNFTNSSYISPVQIYQSTMNMYNNQPMLSDAGTSIYIGESSTGQMAPTLDGNGNLQWYGGLNIVTSTPNDNIYFDEGSNAITDLGQNCLNVNSVNQYNIEGILDQTNYYCTENSWTNNPPSFNIIDGGGSPVPVVYQPALNNCSGVNILSAVGYNINDRGDGIIDSLTITLNYGQDFSGNDSASILYSQAGLAPEKWTQS